MTSISELHEYIEKEARSPLEEMKKRMQEVEKKNEVLLRMNSQLRRDGQDLLKIVTTVLKTNREARRAFEQCTQKNVSANIRSL